jgi:hypothetical protein
MTDRPAPVLGALPGVPPTGHEGQTSVGIPASAVVAEGW